MYLGGVVVYESYILRNYSGTLFAPPAAAHEKKEDEARAPRAPAMSHPQF